MDYVKTIKQSATDMGINDALFLAICTVESSLNPLAIRYEPNWKYFYFPREHAENLGVSLFTENMLQSCSFGLCQIMGGVARELGFRGNLTTLIAEPETALKLGAVHLKSFLQKYGQEVDAISAYNQGSNRKTPGGMFQNQTYVDKVHAVLSELRKVL